MMKEQLKSGESVHIVDDIAVSLAGAISRGTDMPEFQESVRIALEIAAAIAKALDKGHGIKTEPQVTEVLKTNGKELGITFRTEESNVAPTIYPMQMLESGMTMAEVVQRASNSVYEGIRHGVELPTLTPEEARKHIRLVLVNTAQNQEMLNKAPHFDVAGGELSAVPRWQINEEASFLVTNQLCSSIGITGDEALALGQKNVEGMDFQVQSMSDMLREMMGDDMFDMMMPDPGPEMLVVTSPNKVQGSAALLDEKTMGAVHDRLGGDFVVLPSSIHEVICLPIKGDMSPDDLRDMVQSVNAGQVAPQERLSDQVFTCDGHKLTVVGETFKQEQTVDAGMKMNQSICMAM